jgi:hypothetical protein
MTTVTIHSYDKRWENAEVVGIGKDTLTGEDDVLIVHHPEFVDDADFYAKPDARGRHFNVGNRAFWITGYRDCHRKDQIDE